VSTTSETRYAVTRDGVSIAYRLSGSGEREIVFIPPIVSNVEFDSEDPYVGCGLSAPRLAGPFRDI
jgi:hypothetical protein